MTYKIPINTTTLTRKKEFEGDAGDRRLVTGVRSGWGRASRSMRMKYHICQQPVVEFGRVSVNTNALWGEASRDARACVTSTVGFQPYSNSLVILQSKLLNVHNAERHILIQKNRKIFTLGGKGGMGGRRREGTCDRGQVRVGTRFALNENEVPYLPAVRRRVWTCVRGHRRSLG